MKNFLLSLLCFMLFCFEAHAQDARFLIKDGIALTNQQHYTEAIEKYKAALVLEPENASANYQMGFALNASGKGLDALPYLQKAVSSNASPVIVSSAYTLMGSIYDQSGQAQRAIASYLQGIHVDSTSFDLRYNLGLAYFRSKQYAEAEQSAVAALKIDLQNAPAMRLYALVAFHQNKRAAALLGLCTFLELEPNGPHAAEANNNIQHIIQGGALKPEPGAKMAAINADVNAYNQAITKALADVSKRKHASAAVEFTDQLQAMFTAIGQIAEKQPANDLFHQQALHYYQMAQSGGVPAFAKTIGHE